MTSFFETRTYADNKNLHSFNFTVILARTTALTLFSCTVLILFASPFVRVLSLKYASVCVRLQHREGATEANNHFRYCVVFD